MTCSEFRPLLAALGDGSLPERDREAVGRHLTSCGDCRELADRRARLGTLLQSAFQVPSPPESYFQMQRERILGTGVQAPAPRSSAARSLIAIGGLLAASFLLVILGPRLLHRQETPTGLPPSPKLAQSTPAASSTTAPEATAEAPSRVPAGTPVAPGARPEVPAAPLKDLEALPVNPPPAPVAKTLPKPEALLPKVDPPLPAPAVALAGPPAGTAQRVVRMTKEAVEVALAETPSERVLALCAAAESQLEELRRVVATDPVLAVELAAAYRVLVSDGVGGVLRDGAEPAAELAAARDVASRRARDHEATLASLGGGASGDLKTSLRLALEASRELSGR